MRRRRSCHRSCHWLLSGHLTHPDSCLTNRPSCQVGMAVGRQTISQGSQDLGRGLWRLRRGLAAANPSGSKNKTKVSHWIRTVAVNISNITITPTSREVRRSERQACNAPVPSGSSRLIAKLDRNVPAGVSRPGYVPACSTPAQNCKWCALDIVIPMS